MYQARKVRDRVCVKSKVRGRVIMYVTRNIYKILLFLNCTNQVFLLVGQTYGTHYQMKLKLRKLYLNSKTLTNYLIFDKLIFIFFYLFFIFKYLRII